MGNIWFLAVLAALFFGLWPYALNASRAKSFLAATSFCVIQALLLLALMLAQGKEVPWRSIEWKWILVAGLMSGSGLLIFTRMCEVTTDQNRASWIAITTIGQVVVSMGYFILTTKGEFSITRLIGFVLAGISIILMYKKDSP